jgi:hypothetical protein
MAQTNFRLSDDDLAALARVAAARGLNRTELVRTLVRDEQKRLRLRDDPASFIDRLLNTFGPGALLTFTIAGDEEHGVVATVTPGTVDPLGRPFEALSTDREQYAHVRHELDHRERLTIELEDVETGARVFVATVPRRLSSTFTTKVIDLHPILADDADN